MKAIIYDLEILNCIPDRSGAKVPGLSYCEGWGDYSGMGISAVGWAPFNGTARAVPWDDLEGREAFLTALGDADALIGFNSANFDDNLLWANGVQSRTSYDLLQKIRLSAYGSTDWRDQPQGYSYKLADIVAANGWAKTGRGDLAPVQWQRGQRQKVIDYCRNDVAITQRVLFRYLGGELIDPNTGEVLAPVA